MKSLYYRFGLQTENIKALIIFVTTIICAALIFLVVTTQMNCEAKKSMAPYAASQSEINKYIGSLKRPPHLDEKYFTTFKIQQRIMDLRKGHHLHLSFLFFRNYYGVLILTMLFTCFGAVVLFVLVNRGWAFVSKPMKALFLAIVMIITFCGFFPLVFKQHENFDENIKYYMNYNKAEMNIIDQLSRLENPLFPKIRAIDSVDGKPPVGYMPDSVSFYKMVDSMINVNDKTINELTNYVLTIDATEIKSMGDVYKMMNNSTTGNFDSTKRKN